MRRARLTRPAKPRGKPAKQQRFRRAPKKVSETVTKDTGAEINDVVIGSVEMKGNASRQAATHIDSLTTLSPESVEKTDACASHASDQKQKDTLEGFIAWDED
jgi:hypothetical protein